MKKFVPERKSAITGFWVPQKGEAIDGVLEEFVPGEPRPFYVIRTDGAVTATIRTREDEVLPAVDADSRIGVSAYLDLRGLEKFVGHSVRLECTGERKARTGRAMKTFDVQRSEDPVERNGRARANGAATDEGDDAFGDELPF